MDREARFVGPAQEVSDSGWCVLRGVLDRADLEALRAAFADAGRGHTEHVEVTDDTPHADLWRSLANRQPVAGLVAALLGGGPPEVGVHGRNPRPGGGAQGLHADQPAAPGAPVRALTLLWMLDPFTEANGATRLVPGSHRARSAVPRAWAQPGRHHPDEVIVAGDPGDVLVFDSHLWHSGRTNRSDHGRRSVQMLVSAR